MQQLAIAGLRVAGTGHQRAPCQLLLMPPQREGISTKPP